MFRIPFTSLLFAITIFSFAQQSKTDSLDKLLRSHPQEDSLRLRWLNELAFVHADAQEEPDKGLQLVNTAILIGTHLNDKPKLARAYLLKAVLLCEKFDYGAALSEAKKSLAVAQAAKDSDGEMDACHRLGRIYSFRGEYNAAIAEAQKAFDIAGKSKNLSKQADYSINMGASYYQLSNYPQAVKSYLFALSSYEKLADASHIALAYGNLGLVYRSLDQNKKAIDYYEKSWAIYHKLGKKEEEAKALGFIGTIYDQMNQFTKALAYYHLSYSINSRENYIWGLLYDYGNMGLTYISLSNYDSAIQNLKAGLQLAEKVGDRKNKASILQHLGRAVMDAPKSVLIKNSVRQGKRFLVAETYLNDALSLNKEIEHVDGQFFCWEALTSLHEKQGKYRLAFEAQKKMLTLKDSLFNDEKKTAITRAELQYIFDKERDSTKAANEKQQALAAAELRQKDTIRNFILASAGLVLLSGLLLFFSYKRRRDAVAKKNDAELKAHIADTEMKVMRLQMNPHFIFNSLNSISDYIHKNNLQEADAYLSKFAKVMRMTLENSEKQDIPLEDDLQTLELYMQLEAKRLSNKFTYEINVSPEVDKENTLVPPMIFQPFVENSIWHGIANKEGQGHIVITIGKDGEILHCLIDDDGVGRQNENAAEASKERQSLGMKITKARIDILNKLKGSAASVQLIDKPQGLSAQLKLPLQTAF